MPPPLTPIRRRILFAALFEGFGLLLSTAGLLLFTGAAPAAASGAAFGTMTLALAWNYAFNAAFEAWEARQTIRGRSWRRRLIHAALFEAGLMALLVPFLAWWLGITLLQAFLADLGLLLFFALYTPLFTLAFDRVFGLPASAR